MKKRIQKFWQKPHLLLGNSFSKNGKEVKRRLKMSLKQQSPRLKMMYSFLGLVLCVVVASAFKINIQTIPSLIEDKATSSQKSFAEVNKIIPSIKVRANHQENSKDVIFITDLEGNQLNPRKAITTKSVLVNVLNNTQNIEVVEMLGSHFYKGKKQKGVGVSGNQLDVHRHFDTEHNGKLEIKITKIKENGIEKDISENPYTQTFKIQYNPKNDPPYKVHEDGGKMYLGLRSFVSLFLEKKYRHKEAKKYLRYEIINGTSEGIGKFSLFAVKPKKLGKLEVKAYYKDKLIKSKTFEVVPVTSPEVRIFDSAFDRIESSRPVESKYLDSVRVQITLPTIGAVPIPKDRKYEAEAVELTQFRGGSMISSQVFREKNKRGEIVFDMSKMDLQTGDGFNLKVINVHKITKEGEVSKEIMSNPNTQFSTVVPKFNKE